jgi:HTH-type transcriptional regulator / antitoxin HigA
MTSSFQPNWASPPGKTIVRLLTQANLSQADLSSRLGISSHEMATLLSGASELSGDTAAKLATTLGGSADYWLRRDADFREDARRIPIDRRYEANWLKLMPYSELVSLGWIKSKASDDERAAELLGFFGVTLSAQWNLRYNAILTAKAFRATAAITGKETILSTWLRYGEVAGTKIVCQKWNPAGLRKRLDEIRALTRNKRPIAFIPELRRILSDCGVALVIARTPSGCAASGAAQFLSKGKALLLLSFRYKTDDQFWFSCFHEIGHLLLHDIDRTFVDEGMDVRVSSRVEIEANKFAADSLIPESNQDEMVRLSRSAQDVIRFARKIGVAPGIVVGQLQHRRLVPYQYLHGLKRRFAEDDIDKAATL